MKSINDILLELVSIQSDTGTKMECDIARYILNMIKEDKYFQEHKEYYGEYIGNDHLNRPVIWALKKGKSNRTIILVGHYDCVEINCYGDYKDCALYPTQLKKKFAIAKLPEAVKKDVLSDDWMFGRGVNDMKSGLAINLYTLFNHNDVDINILLLCVQDEENLSSGMRNSVDLLFELKEKFSLEYSLLLLTEPHMGEKSKKFEISTGTVGKVMPIVFVKGELAHGSEVMSGLNSSFIMSKIINNIELNYNLCSKDMGIATQPPTVLYNRDLKKLYDVSVPEYSVAYFNHQFLKDTNASQILQKIKNICSRSIKDVIKKYDSTFDYMYSNNLIKVDKKRTFEPQVITFKELEEIATNNNPKYPTLKKALNKSISQKIGKDKLSLQEAGIITIKKILEYSKLNGVVIVVGYIPPYYPAVKNSENLDRFVQCIEDNLAKKFNMKLSVNPYFMGICDISYTACTDIKNEKEIMSNMVTQSNVYSIDFKHIEKLNIPSIVLGPLGKDYHTMYERVYIKDVTDTVPKLIDELIKII